MACRIEQRGRRRRWMAEAAERPPPWPSVAAGVCSAVVLRFAQAIISGLALAEGRVIQMGHGT